jgi:radical SAM family uncharacterized protein
MVSLDSILFDVAKPARYTGGEWNSIVKPWDITRLRVALCYPDVYEIGMSNMAVPILYDLLNREPDVLAERVFAPWPDMEAAMRENGFPLFSLESKRPIKDFDIFGFSLGYELAYTNVLNLIDLAGMPVLSAERDESCPLVIAGGTCVLNPEPLADFVDVFLIGDGEEVVLEMMDAVRDSLVNGRRMPRKQLLRRLASIPGCYVPSLYDVSYQADGTIETITPNVPEACPSISRRVVAKMPPPVTAPVVPFLETVHDRAAIEIQRGCTHGCRFCQAGIIYRPIRVRPQEEIIRAAGELIDNCGYTELSLVSLSTSDYPDINSLVGRLIQRYPGLSLSLPSLHVDAASVALMSSLPQHGKTGLTFAPEAGSDKMRLAINKDVTEATLLETAAAAFEKGWNGLKLYFLIGLPYENDTDIEDIVKLTEKVRQVGIKTRGRPPMIRVTVSTFVPKPHTPFQWAAQANAEGLNSKHELLRQGFRHKGVKMSWQNPEISELEAVMSRGDRRLGKAILEAWRLGSKFDSWSEHLNLGNWRTAFAAAGLDPAFYAKRERGLDEILPWSHIETGISPDFLKREYRRSIEARTTGDCRTATCNACGLERLQPLCLEKLKA